MPPEAWGPFWEAVIADRRLMEALVLGPYNRAFRPHRTEFDWLSERPVREDHYRTLERLRAGEEAPVDEHRRRGADAHHG